MLNKIIKSSLHNRAMVISLASLLIVAGYYTASKMEVDVFPDLTAPTVAILTEAPGMAPEDVERLVTFSIETGMNGASSVRRVRSSSSSGFSVVWVEFDWGTDIFKARQIVSEKLSNIGELPLNVSRPVMAPQSSIMGEVMFISLTGKTSSLIDIRSVADWQVRTRLLSVPGVAQITVIGGEQKEYQVLASPQKMNQLGVSMQELLKACSESSIDGTGGIINQYGNEYIIRGIARTNNIDTLANAVIKSSEKHPIKISDVAELKIGTSVKFGDGADCGKPAVIITVLKQSHANTLELTGRIDDALAELKNSVPADITINSHLFRQADFINASISNIRKTLWEGCIFVVVILFLFLMNWRATLISLIAIPISLLAAVLVLKAFGFTINTMSLGGMAIAIGDLVDDAIIDVENVLKRLKENAAKPKDLQENKLEVIYNASVEIRTSVINATFIIIVAFVPLFFLTGMEGRLLAPLGIAFIVSLFASLIIAITLTPVLCSYLLGSDKFLNKQHLESWLVRKLSAGYSSALQKTMKLKVPLLAVSLIFFVVSLVILFNLGRSFLPEFNEGSLVVTATSKPGISLEESNKIGNQVEMIMLQIPEVKSTSRRTGRAELDEHTQGINTSEIDAPFVLTNRSRAEFVDDVREKLSSVHSAVISLGQPISHRIDHMMSGTRANIAIKIYGTDLSTLFSISNNIKNEIDNITGLVDVNVEQQTEIPQLQLKPNRHMMAVYGITAGDFASFTNVAFGGQKVADIYEGSRRFDMIVKYDSVNRGSIENMKNTLMDAGDGTKIPLAAVAEVISSSGPNNINREEVQRRTIVSANISGRDQKTVVDEIKKKLSKKIKLPEGYHIVYAGQFEAEAAASGTLLLASLASIAVIFFLLFHEFKKVGTAAVILLNLPLALIGGVVSIWLTSGMLSIPAIIGFITLFGIATRNGILLVSHFEALRTNGLTLYDAIMQGSVDRLSPILMTALTAGLALIPLALNGDLAGNEIQSPMAKVILGGLLSSTLLNLFVVPAVYYLVNNNSSKQ